MPGESEAASEPNQSAAETGAPGRRLVRLLLVVAGIVLGQAILYGPSLVGSRILLPLDVLAEPGVYLPAPEREKIQARHDVFSDLVYVFEPVRRFAASEVRAGRLPAWMPYEYCGAPVIWPRFSPFMALEMCTASPVILAWAQLFAALVAGTGAYIFFRRVLGAGFWPAAIGAWCYPLTAFFVFWQGYPVSLPVYWLPWILLAVYYTVARPGSLAPAGLSVATGLVLVSGNLDVAGQVLLVSGLFAVWRAAATYGRAWAKREGIRAWCGLALGWSLGLLVACPHILPTVEYVKTGARMERRAVGEEERPPGGLKALPQVLLPEMYGRDVRSVDGNQLESSAAAFVGIVATLFAAPLAFCSRRHRSVTLFLAGLTLFSLSWCLNLPGFVQVLRLPLLKMMSHNRLVFAACFAVVSLAVIGLDVLARGRAQWRAWFWAPAGLLALLLGWCVFRSTALPEPFESDLAGFILNGRSVAWIHDLEGVRQVQSSFANQYMLAAVWCAAALAGWLVLLHGRVQRRLFLPGLGIALAAELLSFGYGRNAQTDPALYYPPIPALTQLAQSAPGRVIGFGCLPANLAGVLGLNDVRGYDAVDPARITELIDIAASTNSPRRTYSALQYLLPKAILTPSGDVAVDPVLDMLNVEYVIFRGSPFTNARPVLTGADYWVLKNPSALPRVYIPQRVQAVPEAAQRLAKLTANEFNPREVAYVEIPVSLPDSCSGTARISRQTPTAIDLAIQMMTPGLVVLADRWDPGWTATLNGVSVPILRVNHALRGVVVPAGAGSIQFRYQPLSFTRGVMLAAAAALLLAAWAARVMVSIRARRGSGQGSATPNSVRVPHVLHGDPAAIELRPPPPARED